MILSDDILILDSAVVYVWSLRKVNEVTALAERIKTNPEC